MKQNLQQKAFGVSPSWYDQTTCQRHCLTKKIHQFPSDLNLYGDFGTSKLSHISLQKLGPGSCIETKCPTDFFCYGDPSKVEMIYAFMLNFVTLCAARLSWFGCYVKTVTFKTKKTSRVGISLRGSKEIWQASLIFPCFEAKMMEVAEFHQVCDLKWQT